MIQPKCQHCGKSREQHQAIKLHCPVGQKRRAFFWQFDPVKKFTLKPPKPRARMNQRSEAKGNLHSQYMAAKRVRLREHPQCECCVSFKLNPVRLAQDGHHPFGQAGKLILVFVIICRECHDRIHGSPGEARSSGWLCDKMKVRFRIAGPVKDAVLRAGMPELLPHG